MWAAAGAAARRGAYDVWMMLEFAKRFRLKEVWARRRSPVSRSRASRGQVAVGARRRAGDGYAPDATLYDSAVRDAENRKARLARPRRERQGQRDREGARREVVRREGVFEEYAQFGRGHEHDLASFDTYYRDDRAGLRWPVVDGKETKWRFLEGHDPYVSRRRLPLLRSGVQGAATGSTLDDVTDPKPTPLPGKAKICLPASTAGPG